MIKDVDKLLKKAKWGQLTANEIYQVISEVDKTTDRKRLYTLLHIIGRSNAKECKNKIESYLFYKDYPMISGLCLKILCNYWSLIDNYVDVVEDFLSGVDWDRDGSVKLEAIYVSGRYIAKNHDSKFMQILLKIFEDTSERPVLRGAAYEALARSVGIPREEIPSPRDFKDASGVDENVLLKVRKKIYN